jgi:hypothetical protein
MCRGGSVAHSKHARRPATGISKPSSGQDAVKSLARSKDPIVGIGSAPGLVYLPQRTPQGAAPNTKEPQHEDDAQSKADPGRRADISGPCGRRHGTVDRYRPSRGASERTEYVVPGGPAGGDREQTGEPRNLGHQHLPRVLVRLPRAGQRRQEHLGRTEPARGAPRPGIRPSAADSGGLVLGPLRPVSLPPGSTGAGTSLAQSSTADFADTQASVSAKFCVRAEYAVNTSCAGADLSGTVPVARAGP